MALAAAAVVAAIVARGGAAPQARIAAVARLCREFRYAEAERALSTPLEGTVSPVERGRFAAYAALVRLEADHFRRVAGRLRSGARSAVLGFRDSAARHDILGVDENGLRVRPGTRGEGEAVIPWDRVPERAAYSLMMDVGGERTSLAERLAVSVFAQHRGLARERDEEFRIADTLARTPEEETVVRWVRLTLDAVGADAGPPSDPSRPRAVRG